MSSTATGHVTPAAHYAPPADLSKWQRMGLVAAVVGGVGCVAGVFMAPAQFFQSYLVAFLFWIAIALGCLGLNMLNHMTHGAWGVVLRRIFEAGAGTLPVMLVLFVPLLFGLPRLYQWAQPAAVAGDVILQQKAAYLNANAFTLRTAGYFLIWILLATLASRFSLQQDKSANPILYRNLRRVAAPGLILFVLTVTFATIDWLMSLEAHWFSSIYGVQFLGGCLIAALSWSIVVAKFLVEREPMSKVLRRSHFLDHGKLLFAFLLLWGYFTTSQFLIIWSANLPEETPYFLKRFSSSWKMLSLLLVMLHFWFPFLSLLSKKVKGNPKRLAFFAVWLLFFRWWELYFQAGPNFHPEGVHIHWLDVAAVLGIGGVFTLVATRHLMGRSLLPVHDPFLAEALNHE